MKKTMTTALTAGMGTALVAAGAAAGVALATVPADAAAVDAAPVAAADQGAVAAADQAVQSPRVALDTVEGTFAFTQTEVSSNDWLARHIGESSKYLCGSEAVLAGEAADAESWTISVGGAVENPYEATIGELAQTEAVQSVLMGCSCAGNPADGLSVANALVEGISVVTLVHLATPAADANTIVFTSADGYEIALPLSYIESHYCPLVFNVNGSALVESVGGTNQLWLGSTPASYFARDIVSIRLEARAEAPASPTSDEARETLGNLPNVGVLFGGEIA